MKFKVHRDRIAELAKAGIEIGLAEYVHLEGEPLEPTTRPHEYDCQKYTDHTGACHIEPTAGEKCNRCKNGCLIAVDGNGNGSCQCECHSKAPTEVNPLPKKLDTDKAMHISKEPLLSDEPRYIIENRKKINEILDYLKSKE